MWNDTDMLNHDESVLIWCKISYHETIKSYCYLELKFKDIEENKKIKS